MKERLDVLLVKRGLAPSREKAKAMIMAGNVFVDGQREDKAGTSFPEEVPIEIHGHTLKYVSRGGLKLEKAMQHFDLSLDGKICMDIGASTGGYRLYAAKWCSKGLCSRCWIWTVCMEASSGFESCLHGKDEYPICDTGGYCRCTGFCLCGCVFYFSDEGSRTGERTVAGRRGDGLPD